MSDMFFPDLGIRDGHAFGITPSGQASFLDPAGKAENPRILVLPGA